MTSQLRLRHLKIKIASLGLEQAYIHQQERSLRKQTRRARVAAKTHPEAEWAGACAERAAVLLSERLDIRVHRWGLQHLSRHNQLAYAFLRGRSYATTEIRTVSRPDFGEIKKIAERFGPTPGWDQGWDAWLAAAEAHLADVIPATRKDQEERAHARKARRLAGRLTA